MNALNPKTSLLVKLAELVRLTLGHSLEVNALVEDLEVLEWYDRMAELEFVPARVVNESHPPKFLPCTLCESTDHKTADCLYARPTLNSIAKAYDPEPELIGEKILPSSSFVLPTQFREEHRRGYQLFCCYLPTEQPVATYCERATIQEALDACLQNFPPGEGYVGHGVKDIETQVETYADGTKVAPVDQIDALEL